MVKIVSLLFSLNACFLQRIATVGFDVARRFLCGNCSRYRFNRVGRNQRRCLLWISTQAKSLPYQPPPQTINARVQETSIPHSVVEQSVRTSTRRGKRDSVRRESITGELFIKFTNRERH